MSHIEKRGPSRYRVRYIGPEGKEKSKTFTRLIDAQKFRTTTEADLLRGTFVDPTDKTTVSEYALRWASARSHRQSTERRVKSLIKTHITGTSIGGRRVRSVLPSDMQAWATDRSKILAPSTLRLLVSLMRSIYAAAVLDRLVAVSPVVRLSLPPARRERLIPLTVTQVRKLAAAMPDRNRAMVITQAGLGLRIGELLALRIEDVDFLRRTVRVDAQLAPGSKIRSAPKTPTSRRSLPLPQVVAEALAIHMASYPPAEDRSIFYTRQGAPYRHDYYGTIIFKEAVKNAGLPTGTTSHALRHHYASVLLARGESVVAVAERLGHDNATLVLSTYGHLMPDSEDRTRKAIDEAWSEPDDGLQTASQ